MRLRTYNKRKARRTRAAVVSDRSNTFCYILFEAPFVYLGEVRPSLQSDNIDLVRAVPKGFKENHWRFVSRCYCYDTKKQFPSYADAIVWLTKIKLSLMDKPEKYRLFKLAKIVEGYYDARKREHITRTTDLTNVSHSLPTRSERRAVKQRQLREQRQQQLRHAKVMARAALKAKRASSVWNSWASTGFSGTTPVGGGWDATSTVSSANGSTTGCFN